MRVWEINGEDLVVASCERQMRELYVRHHGGDSIRGSDRRIADPDEVFEVGDDPDDYQELTAEELAKGKPRYIPALT